MHFRNVLAVLMAVPGTALAGVSPAPVEWTADLHQPIYSVPRVVGGTVYVDTAQSRGPNVFAIQKGRILWRYATGGAVAMPLTVGGEQVFAASDVGNTHYMRAINARTGRLVWDYRRQQPPQCMCSHITHYEQNLLFAETDGHSLYAFHPVGSMPDHRIWRFAGDGARLTAPAVAGNTVVFGSADHRAYGLAAATGKLVWQQETGYAFVAEPAVWKGLVILGNRGGTVHAYAAATGKPVWSFSTTGPVDVPAIVWRDRVFVASGPGDRGIYALSAKTGKQLWHAQMADYTPWAPVLDGHTLVVASRDGDLTGFSVRTGKARWRTRLHGEPMSQPVLWQQKIVLKIGDHRIGAYSASNGQPVWEYAARAVVTDPVAGKHHLYIGTSAGKLLSVGS